MVFVILFCNNFLVISALVIKNDTSHIIKIISFIDAQEWEFFNIPEILKPQQIIDIKNISHQNRQCKQACLERLTMVMQINTTKHVLLVSIPTKDLSGMYNGFMGLTFGIPKKRKVQRRYYELQEKFPSQLNVRTQHVASMKKC